MKKSMLFMAARLHLLVVLALSAASSLGAGFSGVHSDQIDLDENPMIVTNVTFDGLATLVDITNIVDSISTNFVPALRKEIADASEAGTNYVDSATNLLSAAIDEKYDKQADGIPKGDLSAGVQASLDKADTAVQPAALSNYKPLQEPVTNSSDSTAAAYSFVTTVTQDVNGVIYVTRRRIPTTAAWNPGAGAPGSATDALTQRGVNNFRKAVVCDYWYPTTNYQVGAFVLLDATSKCYVCTNAHVAAASWTAAEAGNWKEVTVADVLEDLATALGAKASKSDATLAERGFSAWTWDGLETASSQHGPVIVEQNGAGQWVPTENRFLAGEYADRAELSHTWSSGDWGSLEAVEDRPLTATRASVDSAWTFDPATTSWGETIYMLDMNLASGGTFVPVVKGSYGEPKGNATSTSLVWHGSDYAAEHGDSSLAEWGGTGELVGARTALPGYILGPDDPSNPNRDKPLASEAEAEALRTEVAGKVPATRTVNGKALASDVTLTAADIAYNASATVSAKISSVDSRITAESTARANADAALRQDISELDATVGEINTSLDAKLDKSGGTMTGAISFDDNMPAGGPCSVYYNNDQWHFKDHMGTEIVTPQYVGGTLALSSDIDAAISPTEPAFSNAVLAVGLGIDTNTVAAINALVEQGEELPIGGATTVGALLLALAAALAALKSGKLDKSDVRYAVVSKPLSSGAVTLDDRASNVTETSAASVSVAFPDVVEGKMRDFVWFLNATGSAAPAVTYTSYCMLVAASGTSLAPESGMNAYSFTEVAKNKFVVSRIKLEVALENGPSSASDLAAAMQAAGYTQAQTSSAAAMASALGLAESATFEDCIDKFMYE